MIQNSNILITGASGFVGLNLSEHLLSHNYNIVPISLRKSDWQNDIPNDINVYIHLVGKAHDLQNTSNPEEYFKVNTELTKVLFDQFIHSTASRFIYFSSVKAAADTVNGILTEEVIPDPLTPYGQSKLAAEEFLIAQELPVDKKVIILRPCMIHGPGNKGNLNLLYQFVNKGIPYPLGVFKNRRSFLNIDNLCFLTEEVIKSNTINSGIYNVADDSHLSTNQLVRLIALAIGKRPRLINLPTSFVEFFASIGGKLKLPLNRERLKKLTEDYVVSNEKIKKELGIQDLPVSVEEGITKTIQSFIKNQ